MAFTLLAELRDGGLDLVMALVDPDGLDGLEGVQLLEEELVFVAPLGHPLARAERVRVGRLAGEALVAYGAGSALRDAAARAGAERSHRRRGQRAGDLAELTARGLGVTLMPRTVVESHCDRLAIRPLSPRQALPVSLVWRAGERPTPAALAFREHVLSAMRTPA